MENPIQPLSPLWRPRLWLHALLFGLTFFTTTAVGARMAFNFQHNLPAFDIDHDLIIFLQAFRDPSILLAGLPYSLTLLLILTAHEFGHWFACLYHEIDASLPYFLPSPLVTGTFGAFIRFRSAVKSRRELFDVGVAGPIAGFLVAIPAVGIGLALSRVSPGLDQLSDIHFGTPALMRALEWWLFPGTPPEDIYLHPVARAAWMGLFATGFNLLPVGQLDGGHLVYACFGERHRQVSLVAIALLCLTGILTFHWPWIAWAAILFFLGRRHFVVYGAGSIGSGRMRLFFASALIFALSFMPVPIR
ncbi:MAG: site-2 protease family protein [Candidatus Solibacter usitatus]|nr:site-2 protease family protein [Candidatus Solibacter usitatus]